jgi:hypothetical protein
LPAPGASTSVSSREGNLKEAAVIETSHVTKNPQCECITLDRTPGVRYQGICSALSYTLRKGDDGSPSF